jgi:hypothetical protein
MVNIRVKGYLDVVKRVIESKDTIVQIVAVNMESIQSLMSWECSKSEEKHQETVDITVSKQDGTRTEVIETRVDELKRTRRARNNPPGTSAGIACDGTY